MSYKIIFEMIGFIGTAGILIAFYLLTNKKLTANCQKYYVLNIVSSLLLMISFIYSNAYSGITLQAIWIGISIYGIWRSKKENKISSGEQ